MFWYFPFLAILPASLYLGGLSNSILFFFFFLVTIIFNLKNLRSNISNIKHFLISMFLSSSILLITWYQYFSNLDFESLRIQSGSQLFPYSRILKIIYMLGFNTLKKHHNFFMIFFLLLIQYPFPVYLFR